jgi:hypothetical protein
MRRFPGAEQVPGFERYDTFSDAQYDQSPDHAGRRAP